MEFTNRTSFPADLYRGVIALPTNRMFGSLFARVTYNLLNGALVPSREQTWKVSPAPWACDYCPMDSDEVFYRGGVDLFIFGSAQAPGNAPTTALDVKIEVGKSFSRSLRVIGNRIWLKQGRTLVPSPPQPFTAIPLTMAHAFGGQDVWDLLPIPFPDNPAGTGYYIDEKSAAEKPLPNIEDPAHLIAKWDDRPTPVGVLPCPAGCSDRFRDRIEFDPKTNAIKVIHPTFFNSAFPEMVVPKVQPGDRISVTGVSRAGPLAFTIPKNPLKARVVLGKSVTTAPPPIDQIGIEPDKNRVFISYRYPYRYTIAPMIPRSCQLLSA